MVCWKRGTCFIDEIILGQVERKETKSMTDSLAFIEIVLAQSALQQSGHYHGPMEGESIS